MKPTRSQLEKEHEILKELQRRARYGKLEFYKPFPKQRDMHNASAKFGQVFFMAGNGCGKTYCGAYDTAFHLTGRYPDWWQGRRFDRPIKAWVANKTTTQTKDITQTSLIGQWGVKALWGTGSIPKDDIDFENVKMMRGIVDLIESIPIRHIGPDGRENGWSILSFKTYEQGREVWQGENLDLLWLDEEPRDDIYPEALARLRPRRKGDRRGQMLITATPLLVESATREQFLRDPAPDQTVIHMTLMDRVLDQAGGLTQKQLEDEVASYSEHERQARIMGIPMDGNTRVFSQPEREIMIEPFEPPAYWPQMWGIDFGIQHPFAAVLIAWDREADTIYVTDCFRMADKLPIDHAAAMKSKGPGVVVAWPQDGTARREFEGKLTPTAKVYKAHGLKMQDTHAKFPDGSNSTEAGILEMAERMRAGKFKVFRHLSEWFDEYRHYHRKDGQLVKVRDDLMSATRVAVMARRGAQLRDNVLQQLRGGQTPVARDIDIDPFG